MKGIVLAGGTGSRLWPITKGVSKQHIPIYDKPMIHYPLGTLFLAGIREILIITTPEDLSAFQRLLGDGSQYGATFVYTIQEKPNGVAEALILGEKFIAGGNVSLILGDNIFHGNGLGRQLSKMSPTVGATIFAHRVANPKEYGVVEFADNGKVLSLEEKPTKPKSNFVVPGLYFYDSKVVEVAKNVKPSIRGELEITSVNEFYLNTGQLKAIILERGSTWLDAGTIENISAASTYVQVIEERQGNKIACLEEIAWRNGWISEARLMKIALSYGSNLYGIYLKKLLA